jgi:hypothetical protein
MKDLLHVQGSNSSSAEIEKAVVSFALNDY